MESEINLSNMNQNAVDSYFNQCVGTPVEIAKDINLRNMSKLNIYEMNAKEKQMRRSNIRYIRDRIFDIKRNMIIVENLNENINIERQILEKDRTIQSAKFLPIYEMKALIYNCLQARNSASLFNDAIDYSFERELIIVDECENYINDYMESIHGLSMHLEYYSIEIKNNIITTNETLTIDEDQLMKYDNNPDSSFKLDALNIPGESMSSKIIFPTKNYETGLKKLIKLSQDTREKFQQKITNLRDSLFIKIVNSNDLIRKYIYTMRSMRSEYKHNSEESEELMHKYSLVNKQIGDVTMDTVNKVKTVETMLDDRKFRPKAQLIDDDVNMGLREEHMLLNDNLMELRSTSNQLYNMFEHMLSKYTPEINEINNAISLHFELAENRRKLLDFIKKL